MKSNETQLRDIEQRNEKIDAVTAQREARQESQATQPPSEKQSKKEKQPQGLSVELEPPEPWPQPVDGAALVSEMVALLERYVVASHDTLVVIAFWAIQAHCYQASVHTPRLNITAPEKGCGKTLVLDLLHHLTPKAIRSENMTTAVLFRLVHAQQPTLLIDEYDSFLRGNEELRGALNAGWQRGGQHQRCVGDANEVRSFRTFTPVALAGIKGLPATLHDRSILIRMKRATKAEARDKKPFDSRHTEEFTQLNQKTARWTADHFTTLEYSNPVMPENFINRTADRWRALFAIADIILDGWPEKLRAIAAGMESSESQTSIGELLLEDIHQIIQGREFITSQGLVKELHELENRPWPEYGRQEKPISTAQLAKLLKGFGIRPKQKYLGTKNLRGYDATDFSDSFDRYLSLAPSFRSARVLEPSDRKGFSDFQGARNDSDLAPLKSPKASQGKGSSTLAGKNPQISERGAIKPNLREEIEL